MFSFTASQAAARARSHTDQQSAAASSITGMSLQEAQQILNISKLNPEEIQKVQVFFLDIVSLLSCSTIKPFRNAVFYQVFPNLLMFTGFYVDCSLYVPWGTMPIMCCSLCMSGDIGFYNYVFHQLWMARHTVSV